MTRTVAIKGFDEELYRLVKTYASLEGRTIASVFEEAVRSWIESRTEFREVRLWVELEREYEENFKVLEGLSTEKQGYALICGGKLIGIFPSYEEAVKRSEEACEVEALIVPLPYRKEEVELGLPW